MGDLGIPSGGNSTINWWQLYLADRTGKKVEVVNNKTVKIDDKEVIGVDVSDGITQDELTKLGINWIQVDDITDGSMVKGTTDQVISQEEAQKFVETIDKWAKLKYHDLYLSKNDEAIKKAADDYINAKAFEMEDLDKAISQAETNFKAIKVDAKVTVEQLAKLVDSLRSSALITHIKERFSKEGKDILDNEALSIAEDLCYYNEWLKLEKGKAEERKVKVEEAGYKETMDAAQVVLEIGGKRITQGQLDDELSKIKDKEIKTIGGSKKIGELELKNQKIWAVSGLVQKEALDQLSSLITNADIVKEFKTEGMPNPSEADIQSVRNNPDVIYALIQQKVSKGEIKEDELQKKTDELSNSIKYADTDAGRALKDEIGEGINKPGDTLKQVTLKDPNDKTVWLRPEPKAKVEKEKILAEIPNTTKVDLLEGPIPGENYKGSDQWYKVKVVVDGVEKTGYVNSQLIEEYQKAEAKKVVPDKAAAVATKDLKTSADKLFGQGLFKEEKRK